MQLLIEKIWKTCFRLNKIVLNGVVMYKKQENIFRDGLKRVGAN